MRLTTRVPVRQLIIMLDECRDDEQKLHTVTILGEFSEKILVVHEVIAW